MCNIQNIQGIIDYYRKYCTIVERLKFIEFIELVEH